ncbi:hypothetical protein [Thermococcus sp.]
MKIISYELRRIDGAGQDIDVWDYSTDCNYRHGTYWTNLPDPTDIYSEESHCSIIDNEEFEIKVLDTKSLVANYEYYVIAKFYRKPEKKGTLFFLQSESEVKYLIGFEWCKMEKQLIFS